MAVFFLRPIHNELVNEQRQFQTLDIEIRNTGDDDFDVLIQGYTNRIPFLLALHKVNPAPDPKSVIRLNHIYSDFGDIAFQFTTNVHSCKTTEVYVMAKDRDGNIVRQYSNADCQIMEM